MTARSYCRASHSRVRTKWSRNSSPRISFARLDAFSSVTASLSERGSIGASAEYPLPTHGAGGSTSFSMPHRPAARLAAMPMYAFMSAPVWRYSMRIDLGLSPMMRTAVVRFSQPHVAVTGAHVFSTLRL